MNSIYTGIISFIVGIGAFVLALLHVISFDAAITIASILGLGVSTMAHSNSIKALKR